MATKQTACRYRIKTLVRDFTHLLAKSGGSESRPSKRPAKTVLTRRLAISHIWLAKSGGSEPRPSKGPVNTVLNRRWGFHTSVGGSEPRPSKGPVNTVLKRRLGISHICWHKLAEVIRDQAKSLEIMRNHALKQEHLLAKSGGSEPLPSKRPVNTVLKRRLGISRICWQNLAEGDNE